MSAMASSAGSHGNNHAHAKVVPAYPPGIAELGLNLCNLINVNSVYIRNTRMNNEYALFPLRLSHIVSFRA